MTAATYDLVAVNPKLKRANPGERTRCYQGVGPDGKDPRTANPAAGRLFTCLNMTMAEFAEQIPIRANGYFTELPGGVASGGIEVDVGMPGLDCRSVGEGHGGFARADEQC